MINIRIWITIILIITTCFAKHLENDHITNVLETHHKVASNLITNQYSTTFPERDAALQTIQVLYTLKNITNITYNLYMDKATDYVDQKFLVSIIKDSIDSTLDDQAVLDALQPVNDDVRKHIVDIFSYVEKVMPAIRFDYNHSTVGGSPLAIFEIDNSNMSSRQAITFRSGKNLAIIFKKDMTWLYRPWVEIHEIQHAIFGSTHDLAGNTIGQTNISDLNVEQAEPMYKDGTTYKVPGSRGDDQYMFMGQLDWVAFQQMTPVINPQNKTSTIVVDGTSNIRGSPGPMSWFDTIVLGPEHSGNPDFLLTWSDNYNLINSMFNIRLIGMFPYYYEITREAWYDLWNIDEAKVSLIPGQTEFKYRIDRMSGPSFNPREDDTPLTVKVRNVRSADIHMYGKDKVLELDTIGTAGITVGPEVNVIIKGFDTDDDFIRIANSDRILVSLNLVKSGVDVIVSFNTKTYNSTVQIQGVDDISTIKLCGGVNDIYGECPDLPGEANAHFHAGRATMVLPTIAFGLTLIFLICWIFIVLFVGIVSMICLPWLIPCICIYLFCCCCLPLCGILVTYILIMVYYN